MLLPSVAAQLLSGGCSEDAASLVSLILMAAQTLVLAIVTYHTERALRRTFSPDGRRL